MKALFNFLHFPVFSSVDWLSYAEPIIFLFFFLHDSTPKVELLGKKGSGNRFLIESCPQEDHRK